VAGYAALADRLDTLESTSAETIGVPYGDAVRAINEAFNPSWRSAASRDLWSDSSTRR
jgi:hypothetical protein